MATVIDRYARRGDGPVRFLPHFEAKLEYLVHKLDLRQTRREGETLRDGDGSPSVKPRQIGNQRVEHDHPGRGRAKP
jgi:hypothetical protein